MPVWAGACYCVCILYDKHTCLQVRIVDYMVRWKQCKTAALLDCENEGPFPTYSDDIAQRIFNKNISKEELAQCTATCSSPGWCDLHPS